MYLHVQNETYTQIPCWIDVQKSSSTAWALNAIIIARDKNTEQELHRYNCFLQQLLTIRHLLHSAHNNRHDIWRYERSLNTDSLNTVPQIRKMSYSHTQKLQLSITSYLIHLKRCFPFAHNCGQYLHAHSTYSHHCLIVSNGPLYEWANNYVAYTFVLIMTSNVACDKWEPLNNEINHPAHFLTFILVLQIR